MSIEMNSIDISRMESYNYVLSIFMSISIIQALVIPKQVHQDHFLLNKQLINQILTNIFTLLFVSSFNNEMFSFILRSFHLHCY